MYRIDDNQAVDTLPPDPTDNIGTPGYFTGGNPGSSPAVPPTRIRYWWLNMIQETLIDPIITAGLALAKDDFTQLTKAIPKLIPHGTQGFGSSGTWVCPPNVYFVKVRIWAAGASGGAGNGAAGAGAAGGGGEYREGVIAVVPGTTYPITIGAGGTAASGFANGVDGGNSAFNGGTIIAVGGKAGQGANGDLQGVGGIGGSGGSGGSVDIPGNQGGGAYSASTSAVAGGTGGCAFSSSNPGPSVMTAGIAGTFPGGGGNGGANTNNSGAGAPGYCILEW